MIRPVALILSSNSKYGKSASVGGRLQVSEHESEQVIPVGKEEIARQSADVIEERLACGETKAQLLIGGIGELQYGMGEEGQ